MSRAADNRCVVVAFHDWLQSQGSRWPPRRSELPDLARSFLRGHSRYLDDVGFDYFSRPLYVRAWFKTTRPQVRAAPSPGAFVGPPTFLLTCSAGAFGVGGAAVLEQVGGAAERAAEEGTADRGPLRTRLG